MPPSECVACPTRHKIGTTESRIEIKNTCTTELDGDETKWITTGWNHSEVSSTKQVSRWKME